MFANLFFEINKSNMKFDEIASNLMLSQKAFTDKLTGKKDFSIIECLILQKILGNLRLDYLFKK